MTTVYISCEGPTEETFVNTLLVERFAERGIYIKPILIQTRRYTAGGAMRGGVSTYAKFREEILNLCHDSSAVVTSMYDFYQFPLKDESWTGANADELEMKINQDINRQNFHMNIIQYEFETLLFSQPSAFSCCMPEENVHRMGEIARVFSSPENINGGQNTAPSKRILREYPRYRKIADGNEIADKIGLSCMREMCPRFGRWINWLESLTE